MRALAVAAVVGFHAFPSAVPGGFVGVDVFFVISGYLITQLICRRLQRNTFILADFYVRRIRRIFPALALVLATAMVAGSIVLFPEELQGLGRQVFSSAFFFSNFYFWMHSDYFSPAAATIPLLHLWSLGVEEQFYFAWPLILILMLRKDLTSAYFGAATLGILSFIVGVILFKINRTQAFYAPWSRAWELMIGASLALQPWQLPKPFKTARIADAGILLGSILIGISILHFDSATRFPEWRALVPTTGAALIIASGARSPLSMTVLACRPMVFVGLISYPLYLWHWPALWLLRLSDAAPSLAARAMACLASVALACATYLVVERPIRSAFRLQKLRVSLALAGTMIVIAVAGLRISIDGLPDRWNKQALQLLSARKEKGDYLRLLQAGKCLLTPPDQSPKTFAPECFSDPTSSGKRILLWGDSAAAALSTGMREANPGEFDVRLLAAGACPPLSTDFTFPNEFPNCTAANSFIRDYLRKTPPDIVILSMASNYQFDLASHIDETISMLKQIGVRKIVVVGPAPMWPYSLPEYILRQGHDVSVSMRMEPEQEHEVMTVDEQLKSVAERQNVAYVSAFHLFCPGGACNVVQDGEPISWDHFHLSEKASTAVAKAIYAAI